MQTCEFWLDCRKKFHQKVDEKYLINQKIDISLKVGISATKKHSVIVNSQVSVLMEQKSAGNVTLGQYWTDKNSSLIDCFCSAHKRTDLFLRYNISNGLKQLRKHKALFRNLLCYYFLIGLKISPFLLFLNESKQI